MSSLEPLRLRGPGTSRAGRGGIVGPRTDGWRQGRGGKRPGGAAADEEDSAKGHAPRGSSERSPAARESRRPDPPERPVRASSPGARKPFSLAVLDVGTPYEGKRPPPVEGRAL